MLNFLKRKHKVKLVVCENGELIGKKVAKVIVSQVKEKPASVIGLATGSSPLPTYSEIIADHKQNRTSWAQVKTFNLDEYIDLNPKYRQESYRSFMDVNLFDEIDIKKENTRFPTKDKPSSYDALIKSAGGIDLQILGLGHNGHIAFNEPGTSLKAKTHIVEIADSTRKANSRFFDNNIALVPTKAITMGLNSILKTKKIVLIATGQGKADAIAKIFDGKYLQGWPCTALIFHKNATVYVDKSAASKINDLASV